MVRTKVELNDSATNKTLVSSSEPAVVDYNRDYIADLVFVTSEGARIVVLFSASRSYSLLTLGSTAR